MIPGTKFLDLLYGIMNTENLSFLKALCTFISYGKSHYWGKYRKQYVEVWNLLYHAKTNMPFCEKKFLPPEIQQAIEEV